MSLAQSEAKTLEQFMAGYRERAKAKVAAAARPLVLRAVIAPPPPQQITTPPPPAPLTQSEAMAKIQAFAAGIGCAVDFIAVPRAGRVKRLSLPDVLYYIHEFTGQLPGDLIAKNRRREVVRARLIFYHAAKTLTKKSFPSIGRFIGRDHATILHGVKAVARTPELLAISEAIINALEPNRERTHG